jgi:phosphonate transport system permease protein
VTLNGSRMPLDQIEAFERQCPGVVRRSLAKRLQGPVVSTTVGALTVWCLSHLGFDVARLWVGVGRLGWLVRFMFPPAHHGWLPDFVHALLETIAMAFLGTMFASLLALPFGFLCARSVLPYLAAHLPLRRLFDAIRGVDSLVWALVFVNVVGLGPFAGVLALTIHNAGDLTKLYSEAIENVDRRQMDGVKASGGNLFAVIRLGMLPQILPNLLSQSMYYFESNTRSATIIGVVGAGGVGLLLTERIRLHLWDEVAFLILMILLAVAAIDVLSRRVRQAVIHGRPAPLVTLGPAAL